MSKLRTLAYKPGHLDCLEAKAVFSDQETVERAFSVMTTTPGCMLTTIFNGRVPIAVVGMRIFREGYAEVYSLISVRAKDFPVSFHRTILALLDQHEAQHSLRRVQMTVKAGHPENERWAESLGFQFEGVLRAFDADGTDHVLFSRVKHG